VLEVENLGKRYGSRWILRDLSFSIGVGDRLAVIGENGSGKSTLLKIVAGLLAPSKGTAKFQGDPRTTLGYSALEQSLYPQLSVAEHLKMAADLRGCPARDEELLEIVGLGYAADKKASELSTGMKARLKMALATQARPSILILDEPSASLDEHGRELVNRIADEQSRRGCLLFATNDPAERRLANLELCLED
jgi:ABC-type multidrug transport system ATPase subunit